MPQLRERARRHPAVTRIVGFFFLAWLFLFTLSSWIDLFQGFELTAVLVEYVRGLTLGVIAGLFLGVPAWLIMTMLVDRFLVSGKEAEGAMHFDPLDDSGLPGEGGAESTLPGRKPDAFRSGPLSVWEDDL